MSNVSSFLTLSLSRDNDTASLVSNYHIWKKNDAKIRNARSGDAEKAEFFLCRSKVYLNVFPKLILSLFFNL